MHTPGAILTGVVHEFDPARGLGRIRGGAGQSADAAADDLLFHCIEIADGTRQIEVGTVVTYRLLRRFGSLEAGSVTAVRSTAP